MSVALNCCIFVLLFAGIFFLTVWLWDVGVQEILVYTEHFLLEETRQVRMRVLPEVTSRKAWDRLELLLFYSGIRGAFPFVSAKVWLLFCTIVLSCGFMLANFLIGSLWKAVLCCVGLCVLLTELLAVLRRRNMRMTERYLLELINVTESFAATGEEPVAILSSCSIYLKGPIGRALAGVNRHLKQGWSSRMILEQLKVTLEHPKWQEFIHNLSVCSMYNSDYSFVFRTSRKSIQEYLSSKKERQSIKHTAQVEMAAIAFLSLAIVLVLSNFLAMPATELLWGNTVSKGCTIYMAGIIVVFFWKIGIYEKE